MKLLDRGTRETRTEECNSSCFSLLSFWNTTAVEEIGYVLSLTRYPELSQDYYDGEPKQGSNLYEASALINVRNK